MTPFPHALQSDTPLHDGALLMMAYTTGGLPPVDSKRVVGIVTEADLFKVIRDTRSEQDLEVPHVSEPLS